MYSKNVNYQCILIALLLSFFLISNSLLAEKPDLPYAIDVRQKIIQSFKVPAQGFLTTDKFRAEVSFCINKKGRIQVTEVVCENKEVCRYIKQEMKLISCKEIPEGCNKTYTVVLTHKNTQGREDLKSL